MAHFDFLVETYRTEQLKTLSLWAQVPEGQMRFRPEARARSPLEHMIHQCLSEDTWMRTMLGITVDREPLPAEETRIALLDHYALCAAERLAALARQPDGWFEEPTTFFEVVRTRAWVLVRRFTHSAHHRGQLAVYLRLWGQPLYSTYGPTADTGGLPKNGATVIYPYASVDALLEGEHRGGGNRPALPGVGAKPPTERP